MKLRFPPVSSDGSATLDNSATITYESSLPNINFTAGPSGGYDVKYWKPLE